MALGMERGTPWRPIFVSSNEKCVFYFRSAEIEFFCETATEMADGILGTTPLINSRPPEIHITALILSRKPLELIARILRKLIPISLEPGWICPLALIR
jgi:hypothetical protein